jgi:hypothetical protein
MTLDPFGLLPERREAPLDLFSATSRYRGLPLLTCRDREGREIVYVARRWVPPPELFADAGRYQVREGDRVDTIAADQFGDPSLFWRLADANRALAPAELTSRVGRFLRITLPAGMPGAPAI